jgi:hypothetical protein
MEYRLMGKMSFVTPIVEGIRSTLGLGGHLRDWICEAWLVINNQWLMLNDSFLSIETRVCHHSLLAISY